MTDPVPCQYWLAVNKALFREYFDSFKYSREVLEAKKKLDRANVSVSSLPPSKGRAKPPAATTTSPASTSTASTSCDTDVVFISDAELVEASERAERALAAGSARAGKCCFSFLLKSCCFYKLTKFTRGVLNECDLGLNMIIYFNI